MNFWTPSAHWAFRAPEFSPFLFKLKAPHNAIAGFGLFARYAALPDWLAWDCFREGNGCATFDEMQGRIGRIRKGYKFVGGEGIHQIGCIVVVNVKFFAKEAWIPQPRDWPVRTLRPTRYDLQTGEGKRVWDECLQRASVERVAESSNLSFDDNALQDRYGSPIMIHPRLGQGAFRVSVTEAYSKACAVTHEHSLPALEAAHIRPFAKNGSHEIRNGLLLRADLHRLFEQGYVTITTDRKVEVSSRLKLDYSNGRSYYPLHGNLITVPNAIQEQPSEEYLQWHNEHLYLG
ncbi:MAG: HNH endonuclease [Ignavibacteriales bacterium]|nr:HNH endonuclease [Ignavibacteriales bacterium]